jgi:AcrR family transcriptional regulator
MTETLDKREKLREERRRQILEAALSVFAQKGFHAANVSDVAAQAGVSQGTIYWYFESKEELLTAALLSFFTDFGEQALGALEPSDSATEKLLALANSMEVFAEGAEGLFTLFVSYWTSSQSREETSRLWTDLLAQFKDIVVAIVNEGINNGEFRSVDAEPLVWALLAAYDGLAVYAMLMPDFDLKRTNQAFVETLLLGLKPRDQEA